MKRPFCGKYLRQNLTFYPAPFRAPLRAFAALVFPWREAEVLLCDIQDRGWCIPSGRVEPNESSQDAVVREALEEAGAQLGQIQYIGCYQIRERSEVRWADCFTAQVVGLEDIRVVEESHGRRFTTLEELPEIYHYWNKLTEEVFRHALEVHRRLRA